jgi:tetratricopeptide (TPR) repeat protein
LKQKDTIFAHEIINILNENIPALSENPIILAKYGKLLLSLGDTLYAQKYLQSAVSILPNLSRPWYYLSIIAYHNGAKSEADNYAKRSAVLDSKDAIGDHYALKNSLSLDFLYTKYQLKFRQWYRSNTLPAVVFNLYQKNYNNYFMP